MKEASRHKGSDDWQARANTALDSMEERPENIAKLTWEVLCKITGVTRSTLWRNKNIRTRFVELQRIHRSILRGSKTRKRRSELEIAAAMRTENEALKAENARHMANYLVIAKRLDERGIDPVQIFDGLSVIDMPVEEKRRKRRNS